MNRKKRCRCRRKIKLKKRKFDYSIPDDHYHQGYRCECGRWIDIFIKIDADEF